MTDEVMIEIVEDVQNANYIACNSAGIVSEVVRKMAINAAISAQIESQNPGLIRAIMARNNCTHTEARKEIARRFNVLLKGDE